MAKRHSNRAGDLESLFLRLEELVLANSGEDEFEEVFKLLIAKLHDETKTPEGETFKPHERPDGTFAAISALLRDADKRWPGILLDIQPALRPEHLQICVEALASHRISNAGLEVLDGFFEFLVGRAAKGAKGQYFTPRHVVEMCVRMINPQSTELVLDPACGSGGFLIHALNHIRRHTPSLDEHAIQSFCASHLWGFDMDARAVRVAKALMVVAGDGSANILRLNSLLTSAAHDLFSDPVVENSQAAPMLTIEDITRTRLKKRRGFDVILTNPPFAGEVRESALLNAYSVSRGKVREERDVLFVERCLDLLRPGGRMAIVLPHNKFASSSYTLMREHVLKRARVLGVVGLGRNTFLPHTHQKASVLFLRKFVQGETMQDADIFFAVSERDGKNSKGEPLLRQGARSDADAWVRLDHDLDEVVAAYGQFLGSVGEEHGNH